MDEGSSPLVFTYPEGKIKKFYPSSGSLLLFPSWLDHHVEENKTNKRITVSFNTVRKSVVLEKFPNSVK